MFPQYPVSTSASHSNSNYYSLRHPITGTTNVQTKTHINSDANWVVDAYRRDIDPNVVYACAGMVGEGFWKRWSSCTWTKVSIFSYHLLSERPLQKGYSQHPYSFWQKGSMRGRTGCIVYGAQCKTKMWDS